MTNAMKKVKPVAYWINDSSFQCGAYDPGGRWKPLYDQAGIDTAIATERDTCAAMLKLSQSELLLMAGEMTAQERRTIQAVLTGLAARIRRLT